MCFRLFASKSKSARGINEGLCAMAVCVYAERFGTHRSNKAELLDIMMQNFYVQNITEGSIRHQRFSFVHFSFYGACKKKSGEGVKKPYQHCCAERLRLMPFNFVLDRVNYSDPVSRFC